MATKYNLRARKPYTTSDGEERVQWINVGTAYQSDDGKINAQVDAIPTGTWWDGRLYLFERHDDKARQTGKPAKAAPSHEPPSDPDGEDDIPF